MLTTGDSEKPHFGVYGDTYVIVHHRQVTGRGGFIKQGALHYIPDNNMSGAYHLLGSMRLRT